MLQLPTQIKRLTRGGFEPPPSYEDEKPAVAGKFSLESHAIDHSAILPYDGSGWHVFRAYGPSGLATFPNSRRVERSHEPSLEVSTASY